MIGFAAHRLKSCRVSARRNCALSPAAGTSSAALAVAMPVILVLKPGILKQSLGQVIQLEEASDLLISMRLERRPFLAVSQIVVKPTYDEAINFILEFG